MQLPNKLRIAWWLVLLLASSTFLYNRYEALSSGSINAVDAVALVFWIALATAPVFTELSFLGISIKQKIEDAKTEMRDQLLSLRTDVQSAVSVNANQYQQVIVPSPLADSELQNLKEQVKEAIDLAQGDSGRRTSTNEVDLSATPDVIYLFKVRLNLERELQRVLETRLRQYSGRRTTPIFKIVGQLAASGLIESRLASAIREVYAICSPAIHGESVSPAQVKFVRDVAPELIQTLRELE